MKFNLIMENWRGFIKEIEGTDKLDPGFGGSVAKEPEEFKDPGLDADGVPVMLKRPVKHSIVIGNPSGKGTESDPKGIFINGEFLGESNMWILGKNSDNFYKRDKKFRNTNEPNPTYRQTHYGTTELIKVIKNAVSEVHDTPPEIYAARFAKMLLGKTDTEISEEEKKYGRALMGLGLYPKETQKLYIEDLGLAPFFTDVYGNTFHGGQAVRGHGSHRTGQDADLGFYMLPGNEMVTRFPKNKIGRLEWGQEDENEFVSRSKGGGTVERGGLGPNPGKLRRKKPIIAKQFLDALVEAHDPNSEDGFSERYKNDNDFQAGIEKVKLFLKQEKIVSKQGRRKNEEGKMARRELNYIESNMGTIDTERTWKLISALFKNKVMQKCIIDEHLHRALRQACERAGDKWPGSRLFHWPNHKNHIHIRVGSPTSESLGRKLAPQIAKSWKKWSEVKRLVKNLSKKGPNWVEDFYDKRGYATKGFPFEHYYPDEWKWNRNTGESGVYDEIMKVIDPESLEKTLSDLGVSMEDELSPAMKEMDKAMEKNK